LLPELVADHRRRPAPARVRSSADQPGASRARPDRCRTPRPSSTPCATRTSNRYPVSRLRPLERQPQLPLALPSAPGPRVHRRPPSEPGAGVAVKRRHSAASFSPLRIFGRTEACRGMLSRLDKPPSDWNHSRARRTPLPAAGDVSQGTASPGPSGPWALPAGRRGPSTARQRRAQRPRPAERAGPQGRHSTKKRNSSPGTAADRPDRSLR